jgi:hypothetical protein
VNKHAFYNRESRFPSKAKRQARAEPAHFERCSFLGPGKNARPSVGALYF